MTHTHRILTCTAALAALLSLSAATFAQDDPFADAAPETQPAAPQPAEPEQPAPAQPAAALPVRPAAGATSAAAAPTPPPETNPAVRAAVEHERKTPADFVQSISWLIELGRPELAKPIFDELAKLPLTDAQRAALVEKFGSQVMLQIARANELAPAGAQFADACMQAAATAAQSPQHFAALIGQLNDPALDVRQAATSDLAAAGASGIAATLEAMAREANPQRRLNIARAAAQMRPLVDGPLLAMLDARDAALHDLVAQLLRDLQITQAVPLLQTDPAIGNQALNRAIARYRAGTPPFPVDENNRVELWSWNDTAKKLSAAKYSANDARTIWLARLVRQLLQWNPNNRDYQLGALVLGLEANALTGAPPADNQQLLATDTTSLNDGLADALTNSYQHAAIALADALGARKDANVLHSADPKLSPLAKALTDTHRRVRFAALRAVMAIDPTTPYPGSSYVPEALAYFANSTGGRRAVVGMPTRAAATDLAGQLAASSLDAEGVNNGRDLVDLSRQAADLELVLVDANILANEIRQVLYELRIHPETAETPIAILAADGRLEAAHKIADDHQRVFAVPRPHSPEAVAHIVEQLRGLAGPNAVAANDRAAEAVDATAWIGKILAERRPLYVVRDAAQILETAVYQTASTKAAINALAEVGRPEAQLTLINLANQPALSPDVRSAAVAAFRKNATANGVLLTRAQIIAQYDRYNASAHADPDTQKILGELLNAIESRRTATPPVRIPPP